MTASPRILLRRDRRKDGIQFRVFKAPTFIDPFPWIPGTLPEKMVFAELSKRHVPFVFQADWFTEVTSKLNPEERFAMLGAKDVVPDFLLPMHKAIIEVQGEYWHSTDEAKERDAIKSSIYEAFHFEMYAMWEEDIYDNVGDQVDRIKGLVGGPRGPGKVGSHVGLGAGTVAIANQLRAKPKTPGLRRRVRRGRRRS